MADACRHENLDTEIVMKDGEAVSSHTKCADCGQRLT